MPEAPVTLLVILVTGVVTWQGFQRPEVMERLIFRPELILAARQWYRLVSSALLHANWWHFGFNALAFLMFGGLLEGEHNASLMLLVYIGAILGGSALSLLLHRHEDYAALGASGGVSGVVFAATFFYPGMSVSLMFLPIFAPAWIAALVFIAISFFGTRHRWGNIGHDAHLGGALTGLGIAMASDPAQVLASDWRIGAVVAAGILSLVMLVKFPHGVGGRLLTGGVRGHKGNLRYQDYDLARERNARRARLDALLDRISQHGIDSLSAAERRELDELSKMFRR
jgi:membrane associated rhomboid family serine protease